MILFDLALNLVYSIVFSVWKKTLDLVSALFSAKRIPFLLIDGSLSLADRRKVLKRFREDPGVPVLLMTLGTGAVGLNLTVANRIHILEPQWNPTVESQAIGRAVRFGQEKTVTVERYIMKDTVEEVSRPRSRHIFMQTDLISSSLSRTCSLENASSLVSDGTRKTTVFKNKHLIS